jgi:predicted acyl esterase
MAQGNSRSVVAALAAVLALGAALLLAAPASADFPTVFEGDVACTAQPANGDVRLCGGPTTTWDEQTKIDVNVILPPAPVSEPDGPYPLIGYFHGWGGSKIGLADEKTQDWAENGYAVFSMSDRGWGNSCGGADPEKLVPTACGSGYNHLMDDRVEVRDAQYLISVLADEGIALPQKIGATGYSYGGGISMALAALRDRTMMPDGSLVPWESPEGKPMSLAAAVPQWPWTDLAYSLMPNGRTLDYVADAPYKGPDGKAPIGVLKSSFVAGLYGLGLASSNYAPPGTDPDADLTPWYGLVNAGEPYDSKPLANDIVDEITTHHSSYYIDHSEAPAPLLIQNGWNDDLFPVDEAVRFYNRTRTQYPSDPISLYLMDDGHQRSQNKEADEDAFRLRQDAWFDYYLKGIGAAPASSVEALTTKCGGPSEGPFVAATWKALAPGEIRLEGDAPQTIAPAAGDPSINQKFDPIAGGGACETADGADQTGAATYRLAPAPAGGFTLIGSPTIIADISAPGGQSAIAARLLDVTTGEPESEALVSRGLLRPGEGGKEFVFQLHPQAYKFEEGHIAKLELLPSDAPYSRQSNAQAPIEIENLELRLPVREKPGEGGGIVKEPGPVVIPPGYEPAVDFKKDAPGPGVKAPLPGHGTAGLAKGRIRATKKFLILRLSCTGPPCSGSLSARRGKRTLAMGPYAIPGNQTQRVRLPLTKAGRKFVAAKKRSHAKKKTFPVKLSFTDTGRSGPFELIRPVRLKG